MRTRPALVPAIAVAALVAAPAPSARALTVNTLIDEADGSATDGDVSLRDALALTPAGGTVDFIVTGTIKLTHGELKVYRSLTIQGPGRANLTISAAGNDPTPNQQNGDGSRVMLVSNTAAEVKVVIRKLKLTGGDIAGNGGAVLSVEDLVIDDCEIADCYASGSGGAVYGSGPYLALTSTAAFRNRARYGGGAVYIAAGRCNLIDLFAADNSAVDGGGVFSAATASTGFNRGAFARNRASSGTGGAIRSNGDVSVNQTLFYTNSAVGDGGAIHLVGTKPTNVFECSFFGNRSNANGGALYANSQLSVNRCKFEDNGAAAGGGAAYFAGALSTLINSTFARNKAVDGGALHVKAGASVTGTTNTFTGNRAVIVQGRVRGGAVFNAGALTMLGVNSFTGNTVTIASQIRREARGSAIATEGPGASLNLSGATIADNGAGALPPTILGTVYANSAATILDSRIERNVGSVAVFVGNPVQTGSPLAVRIERTAIVNNPGVDGNAGGLDNRSQVLNVVTLVDAMITGNGVIGSGLGDVINYCIIRKNAGTTIGELYNDGPGQVIDF